MTASVADPASVPCKRHRRGMVSGWMPVDNDGGTQWAIAEAYWCKHCGQDMPPRIVPGTIRRTQRDAMVAYGFAPEYIEQFFKVQTPAPDDRPAMPLSCWPFPVSTRYYRIKD